MRLGTVEQLNKVWDARAHVWKGQVPCVALKASRSV